MGQLKNKLSIWIVTVLIFAAYTPAQAQISQGGQPLSFKDAHLQRGSLPTHHLPYLDNEKLMQQADATKRQSCSDCEKLYWGKVLDTDIDILKEGKRIQREDGTVWMYRITSPSARGLQLFFDDYHLPPGGKLFVYNEERSTVLGAFTAWNQKDNNRLVMQPIPTNTIIIEYFEPNTDSRSNTQLHISKITHDFVGILGEAGPYGNSESCNVDANCVTPPEFEKPISSVGLILTYTCSSNNLTSLCTGALLNNTNQDATPYFLTANHCVDDCGSGWYQGPSSWVFVFNHEKQQCNDSENQAYTGQSVTGASIVNTGPTSTSGSDYALLEINNTPPADYNVCYAGWDRSGTTPDWVLGLHHPSGDITKASYEPNPYSFFYSASGFYFGTNYWMAIWPESDGFGVTEGGSSGSPLFDDENRVIGQLYGGDLNDCAVPPDTSGYGKFSVSWSDGNLDTWLDPANTGTDTIGAYCPNSTCDGLTRMTGPSGTLSDGSGSGDYPNTSNCRWLIAPPGNPDEIKFTFSSFNTESGQDSVFVYDGDWESAPLLGGFTGSTLPSTLFSTNDTMYVQFISDKTGRAAGWTAHYCIKPTASVSSDVSICYGCSTTLNASGGESYQWSPGNGLSCTNCASPQATPFSTTTYQVIVSNGNYCHDTASVTVTVTGIEDVNKSISELSIIPNPNPGTFKLNIKMKEATDIELKLYDITGSIVYRSTFEHIQGRFQKEIKLNDVAEGLYNLQVVTDQGTVNRKVTIHK